MPRDAYFLVLTLLGLGAGVAMWAIGRPLNRIVGKHDKMVA
jgi:hypothetical protein